MKVLLTDGIVQSSPAVYVMPQGIIQYEYIVFRLRLIMTCNVWLTDQFQIILLHMALLKYSSSDSATYPRFANIPPTLDNHKDARLTLIILSDSAQSCHHYNSKPGTYVSLLLKI